MIYEGKVIPFPAVVQTSFFKIIEDMEQKANDPDENLSNYARTLLEEVNQYPELREGITDVDALPKYQSIIDKLTRHLFPDTLSGNEIKLLIPPFLFQPIRTSKRFDNIIKASGKPFEFGMKDVTEDQFYLYCCYFLLGSYYGYPVNTSSPQKIEIYNEQQKILRTYKLLINADLCEFLPTEKTKEITRADYEDLLDDFGNIALWKEKFPPDSWIMRGIMIFSLVDVTMDQSVSSISSSLMVKTPDSFATLTKSIKSLLGNASLEVGVLMQDDNKLLSIDHDDINSIVLKKGEFIDYIGGMCEYSYEILVEQKAPLVITNVEKFHAGAPSELSTKLNATGFKSYAILPLVHDGESLGFIELASKRSYEIHEGAIDSLKEVLPVIAMAIKRFITEEQNLVEAIIQREYTTLHPAVKWRFEDEARKHIKKQFQGEQLSFKDIVFENLYPLYGQLDIKGSSERRNEAVSKDLTRQIRGVVTVLKEAFKRNPMPAYEELIHRLEAFQEEVGNALAAGSEHKVLNFLEAEVYPVLDHLATIDRALKTRVEKYYAMLDPEVKTVYEARKEYDQTVNQINSKLANFIDEKQKEAQKMFPHYFERYKTDGIEFNMYIGQSITKSQKFDPVYLKNLRLWQLKVMCEMEQHFKKLQLEMNTSIEVASLILAYNTPLSVHFRMDEKQFDVEGAYNARYEIIKKRVDKANIKGTTERITKPGHLVIVYSQEQDAREYRTYLKYLAAKDCLSDEIEDFELEDLQGVHGLRALRVPVAYPEKHIDDQWIKEVEERISQ
ncbi:MAG: GAF domain-containing protein [Cyclobacteriaceae bacterium]